MKDRVHFLAAFVRRPLATGSITPSSAHLAEAMVEGMGLSDADTVVELGPGTGVFTQMIHERLKPRAHFSCFELNPAMARALTERFPQAHIVNDSAENLRSHLQSLGRPSVDCVISGLPWAAFSEERQECLLDATVSALRPGGRFSTFAYGHASWLPAGRRFRSLLESRFKSVETSQTVWKNLPPAFVYRCRK